MTFSGSRNLEFEAACDFIGQLSFIIKSNTIQNLKQREIDNDMLAKKNK